MGLVARGAAVDFAGLVGEDERAAFIDVALHAGLFARVRFVEHFRRLAHAGGGRGAAVGIVAIRAGHEAFVDAVFGGEIELGADVSVALIAEFAFVLLGEEIAGRFSVVDGVAGGAGDVVIGVFGAADVGAVELLGVAGEATGDDFGGLQDAEGADDGIDVTTGVDMGLAGAVAGFAAVFGLKMRVLREGVPDGVVLMAVAAAGVADKTGLGCGGADLRGGLYNRCCRWGFLPHHRRREDGQ